MYKEKINIEDEIGQDGLTVPSDFMIITGEDIFIDLLKTVNNELFTYRSSNFSESSVIECLISSNEAEYELKEYTDIMCKELCEIFMDNGWGYVDFTHNPETAEDDETLTFFFHFSKKLSI